jgi:ribosome-associated protein
MAKTVKRPARGQQSKANEADRAAKGPRSKPPRGKPARPGGGSAERSEKRGWTGKKAPPVGLGRFGEAAKGAPAKGAAASRAASGTKRPPKAKTPRGAVRGTGRKAGGAGVGDLKRKALRPRAPADQAAVAPRPAPEERPDPTRPRAMAIAQAGLDKKAEDVLVLDVRGLTSYADYFVLMTADSERQATAVADHVDEQMKAMGSTRVGSEGYETGRWILIDYGDVVAHVLSREARGFYDLEGLWADAPRFAVAG